VANNQLFVIGDGTDAATFQLNGGLHSFANNVEIRNNATLTGCGTIEGNVTIDPGGTMQTLCDPIIVEGIVTNNGTIIAANGDSINFDGPVVNSGQINAITGRVEFLGGLSGTGVVFTATNTQISGITQSGNNISIQIPSVPDASVLYQLQVTPSLTPAAWTNLSASQSGTGGVLTFTDFGAATNGPSRFYRIYVTAPEE
jgi:hypothetical protein